MPARPRKTRPIPLLALLLAWLVPGAGHAYVGRARRGVIIFVTITATFWAGVAMGGVMTVDYQTERWWFMAEMLTGVNGLVGWHRSQQVYGDILPELDSEATRPREADPDIYYQVMIDARLAEKGLALAPPMDTVARAYAGVAGMLNLICIFDAVMLALMGAAGEPKPPPAEARKRGSQ